GAPWTGQQIADERGGGEKRPRGHLPDGDGIEKLRLRQPTPSLHEVILQERDQNITASVEHRADLEEEQEERPKTDRRGASRDDTDRRTTADEPRRHAAEGNALAGHGAGTFPDQMNAAHDCG